MADRQATTREGLSNLAGELTVISERARNEVRNHQAETFSASAQNECTVAACNAIEFELERKLGPVLDAAQESLTAMVETRKLLLAFPGMDETDGETMIAR